MRSSSLSRLFQRRFQSAFENRRRWPPLPEEIRLEGDGLWLRWPRHSDAKAVFTYASDEAVSRFMDWTPHRRLEESQRFLKVLDHSMRTGREAPFALIHPASEELMGICSLVNQRDDGTAEIGYALRRSAWGQGYMSQAVQIICPWVFQQLPLQQIIADVHPDNAPSQRVLEKAGFIRQADPAYRLIKGTRTAHYRYHLYRPF